ncbi:Putative transposase [Planctomycetes bacterium Poly30]|uniref:Transposase n=1 Tax=Saltatorellus ferox TaxID=2528018 RepID=A0A518F0K5_9BACT|nr:Putative transposase [Planctomycetes bacterium Poly30]
MTVQRSSSSASVKSLVPFGAGAGQPLKRLIDPDLGLAFQSSGWGSQYVPPPLVVNADGFSLHAATLIRKGQRAQLEKLCRYVTRPAISLERFDVRPDGMVSWLLRKAWRDGTKGFVMTPYQFMARLAALAPHPREHQLTYQGVLAPASSLRDLVVPRPVVRKEPKDVDVADEDGSKSAEERSKDQRYIRWADLLKRLFSEDVLKRPRCRGRRHMISVITDPETARKVLEGVRAAARRSSDSLGGGAPSSPGPSRSPPAELEVRILMPPRPCLLHGAAGLREVESCGRAARGPSCSMKQDQPALLGRVLAAGRGEANRWCSSEGAKSGEFGSAKGPMAARALPRGRGARVVATNQATVQGGGGIDTPLGVPIRFFGLVS